MKSIFLVTLFFSISLAAQDSLVVKQVGQKMFSNKYIFYPDGTFKHYYTTDDGQIWYGKGKYTDKGRKRILAFDDPDLSFKIDGLGVVHYESNFQRTLIRKPKGFKSEDFYYTTRKKFVFFSK